MIAEVNEMELKKIEKWGIPFGCAFQIWDDVMNLITESNIKVIMTEDSNETKWYRASC